MYFHRGGPPVDSPKSLDAAVELEVAMECAGADPEDFLTYETGATSGCPTCGKVLNACTSTIKGFRGPPIPGDLTVCGHCATLLEFTEGLGVRELTQMQFAALSVEQQLYLRRTRDLVFGAPMPLGGRGEH